MSDSPSGDDASNKAVEEVNPPEGGVSSPSRLVRELHRLTATTVSGRVPHPIYEKIESEHVTEMLATHREAAQEERDLRRRGHWFGFSYTLVFVAVFVFLTLLLLPEQANIYFQLLGALGIFATGIAGGFGLSEYRNRMRQ